MESFSAVRGSKIGVIGAGAVGSATLLSAVLGGDATEIIVVNRDRKRARAVATDLQYGAALFPGVSIRDGDYDDLAGAAMVLITAGVNEKGGGATDRTDAAGRLRLLDSNLDIYRQMLPRIAAVARDAVILVLTDPPDPLADFVYRSGFKKVLSSGTLLDSLRFRFHLARHLHVDPTSVDANVLGEHGTSQTFVWSSASVAGVPVRTLLPAGDRESGAVREQIEHDVRFANIAIIEGNQASQFGIGVVAARIVRAVLRDERIVVPIGSFNERYGVTLSMPSLLGQSGVMRIFEPAMSADEQRALWHSAETLQRAATNLAR